MRCEAAHPTSRGTRCSMDWPRPSAKSSQVGFILSTNQSFCVRFHRFNCLSRSSVTHIVVRFVKDQSMTAILLREPFDYIILVLQYTAVQTACYAGVKNSRLAGHDVNVIPHSRSLHSASGVTSLPLMLTSSRAQYFLALGGISEISTGSNSNLGSSASGAKYAFVVFSQFLSSRSGKSGL
jgi:hypothetical protein